MVDEALAVLDALGWDAAHVAGHSLGGVVAQALALRAPERVRSLALLCAFAQGWTALPTSLSTA
ncbi:MAG: alpha/beta fold hydrolase [Alphaproteobacteria bacterium]|nr:alpha/beta fold hydrolase [Alphaproteobacteria bacterium]MCB9698508.1 alpha/beta fold hydrolase [Alphaproteobacteria bacterium]